MSKKIMFLWGLIIVLICGSLIVLGNIGNDYNLYKLERNIKLSAKDYLKDENRIPKYNEYEIVYVNELIDNNYIDKDPNIDKYCIKEVKIINKLIINKYEIIKECKTVLKKEE